MTDEFPDWTERLQLPELLLPGEVAVLFQVERTSPSFPARVFFYVDASGDCWEWTGTLDKRGYGVIGRGRKGSGNMFAHRAVWELLVGPIPPLMQYDHLCRNHSCVNPDHGEIVTADENKRRGYGVAVLYSKRTRCQYGHLLDGMTGGRGGSSKYRYCKTCARLKSALRYKPIGPKTHCKRGHEFTLENTYIDNRGRRQCKACKAQRQREARAELRRAA